MNSIEIKARAKINFSIDILGKRQNGYHDVKMIMQTISLHDIIHIDETDSGIMLECKVQHVPQDQTNIAYKAAAAFINRFNIKKGVKIAIEKNIPVSAGLAGGSTDAAAVLRGMNKLFQVNASLDELCEVGLTIGADVPFCIKGGTMLAEGLGEILTPIAPMKKIPIVLVKPGIGASTKWVYQNLRLDSIKERPDTALIIKAIENDDFMTLGKNMVNVLETVTAEKFPVIGKIKMALVDNGAIGSIMSGSGSAVFGIYENKETAENACKAIKTNDWEVFLTETYCEV